MDKAVLIIDMPNCYDECFALDEIGDYPMYRISQEQRGYTFRTRERRMDRCPFRSMSKYLNKNKQSADIKCPNPHERNELEKAMLGQGIEYGTIQLILNDFDTRINYLYTKIYSKNTMSNWTDEEIRNKKDVLSKNSVDTGINIFDEIN